MFKFLKLLFFDLCYETGLKPEKKSLLLDRCIGRNIFSDPSTREGEKTFNNEHGSNQVIYLKV